MRTCLAVDRSPLSVAELDLLAASSFDPEGDLASRPRSRSGRRSRPIAQAHRRHPGRTPRTSGGRRRPGWSRPSPQRSAARSGCCWSCSRSTRRCPRATARSTDGGRPRRCGGRAPAARPGAAARRPARSWTSTRSKSSGSPSCPSRGSRVPPRRPRSCCGCSTTSRCVTRRRGGRRSCCRCSPPRGHGGTEAERLEAAFAILARLTRRPPDDVAEVAGALALDAAAVGTVDGVARLWNALRLVGRAGVPGSDIVRLGGDRGRGHRATTDRHRIAREARDAAARAEHGGGLAAGGGTRSATGCASGVATPWSRRSSRSSASAPSRSSTSTCSSTPARNPCCAPRASGRRSRRCRSSSSAACWASRTGSTPPRWTPSNGRGCGDTGSGRPTGRSSCSPRTGWSRSSATTSRTCSRSWRAPSSRTTSPRTWSRTRSSPTCASSTRSPAWRCAGCTGTRTRSTPGNNTLHVIGRTYGLPRQYFYRRQQHGAWTPWEPMGVEIEGDHIVPVVWRNRLHVFWVTFLEQPDSADASAADDETRCSGSTRPAAFLGDIGDVAVRRSAGERDRSRVHRWDRQPDPPKPLAETTRRRRQEDRPRLRRDDARSRWRCTGASTSPASGRPRPRVVSGGIGGFSSRTEFDPGAVFVHSSNVYDAQGQEVGVQIHLTGATMRTFLLRGRNSPAESGSNVPRPPVPFSGTAAAGQPLRRVRVLRGDASTSD